MIPLSHIGSIGASNRVFSLLVEEIWKPPSEPQKGSSRGKRPSRSGRGGSSGQQTPMNLIMAALDERTFCARRAISVFNLEPWRAPEGQWRLHLIGQRACGKIPRHAAGRMRAAMSTSPWAASPIHPTGRPTPSQTTAPSWRCPRPRQRRDGDAVGQRAATKSLSGMAPDEVPAG